MRQVTVSPFGATLRLIRDNHARAAFLGINVYRAKLVAFVISAVRYKDIVMSASPSRRAIA